MEMKLPQVERIVTETIDGKQVQKQIYADGSYGVRDGDSVERYFPDGKKQTYKSFEDAFILQSEKLPDGTERWWHPNGQMGNEKLPDGTYRIWDDNGQMEYEELPDGTYRMWYGNGQMEYEKLPDGTKTYYNYQGKVTYHATKGVEDTIVYLAKQRIEKKKEETLQKLEDKPKLQKVASKIADTKAFNDIALKVATKKIKKARGE